MFPSSALSDDYSLPRRSSDTDDTRSAILRQFGTCFIGSALTDVVRSIFIEHRRLPMWLLNLYSATSAPHNGQTILAFILAIVLLY